MLATGPTGSRKTICFGPFEFDPHTGELRKHGMRTRLQGQPIEILAMLVQQPGDVVSRDELQKRLWPAETYVDFEHSLNSAMKRLRAALGDSAQAPRYIETLARRGYRFIAPLTEAEAIRSQGVPRGVTETHPTPVADPARAPAKPEAYLRYRFLLIAAMAVSAGVAAGMILASVHSAPGNRFSPVPPRTRAANPKPEAYQAYAKGRFYWNKRTPEGLMKAIGYFEQAIDKEPGYTLAWDGLADSWIPLGWYGFLPPSTAFPNARAAALKALTLDDSLAEAHTSLAFVKLYYDRDWAGAEREFRRAIDLNPNYANAHHWYGEFLSLVGRHKEAIAESERARELDPLSTIINAWVSSRYFYARQYERALDAARNAVEMDPNFAPARLALGQAYEQKGMLQQAVAEFEKATALAEGSLYAACLAHACAIAGRRTEANKVLADLTNMSRSRFVSSYDLAVAHLGLGRTAKAFELLDAAVRERLPRIAFLGVDPRFDALRTDPRFGALLRSIGLN